MAHYDTEREKDLGTKDYISSDLDAILISDI